MASELLTVTTHLEQADSLLGFLLQLPPCSTSQGRAGGLGRPTERGQPSAKGASPPAAQEPRFASFLCAWPSRDKNRYCALHPHPGLRASISSFLDCVLDFYMTEYHVAWDMWWMEFFPPSNL